MYTSRTRTNGQHVTLAGSLHITENCDVENVTIYSDALNSRHAVLDAAFARGVRDERATWGNWYRSFSE